MNFRTLRHVSETPGFVSLRNKRYICSMFSRYILLILFFFCWSSGSAQLLTDKLFFEHLTTEDGLSHIRIRMVLSGWEVIMV